MILKYAKFLLTFILLSQLSSVSGQGFRTTTPYQLEQGKIVLEAHIGNLKGRFMLDTAAPTCVTQDFLDRYQQNISTKGSANFEDSNGRVLQSRIITIPTIRIGTVNFNHVSTAVLPTESIVSQLGLDGIIGYTLFGHVCLHIDSKSQKIVISSEIDTTVVQRKTIIPLVPNPYQLPIINIELNKKKTHTAMLDIGANSLLTISSDSVSTLTRQKALSVIDEGYGATSIGASGVEQNNTKYRMQIDTLRMGAVNFVNIRIENTPSPLSRIGSSLLSYGNIAIDYPKQKLYYTPHESRMFNFMQKDWDVTITAYHNKLIAGVVWGKLRNELEAGTQIVAINGKRFEKIDAQKAITTNLIRLTGGQATITVKKKNSKEEKKYTIYRR